MAEEITINSRIQVTKGGISLSQRASFKPTMSGSAYSANVQTVPTTAAGTALVIAAGVSTLGWAWFKNLDAANYIEIGTQSGGTTFLPFARLNAGEACLLRLAQGITVFAKANTASVNLEHYVVAN